ncbi:MAG: DUF2785 domain-containing protein [Lysobacterales bacterium]
MKRAIAFWAFIIIVLPGSAPAGEGCPPRGYTRGQLLDLKQAGFDIGKDAARNTLALGLAACLSDPDPDIRDGVAFEALAHWMRKGQLTERTRLGLYHDLLGQLRSDGDANGFQRPFAALVLAEVARTDRIRAWFTRAMRTRLVDAAARYLAGVRDYRGFSDSEGWRHGVAHGSDLVLQLVLNPKVNAAQVRQLMAAVASQVAPRGPVFYVFGEPERLARAAYYAYRRGVLDDAAWAAWFDSATNPSPLPDWRAAYASRAGLARRHNTLAFLRALYLDANGDTDNQTPALADMVRHAIGRVSGG